jgi:hypothetical protein
LDGVVVNKKDIGSHSQSIVLGSKNQDAEKAERVVAASTGKSRRAISDFSECRITQEFSILVFIF